MDYEGKIETATDHAQGEAALDRPAGDLMGMAQAGSGISGSTLIPDANNTVVLPEGVTLDDITVRGRDLVVTLDDGRTLIIPDGAVFVPQIVSQGVVVPPLNLAALLIGNEPEPAAGPVRSSGGNFEVPVDPLQNAYNLGDLLPYTELAFPEPNQRQLFPIIDRKPITTPNPDVRLDDDALAGGNAGGTGDDPDSIQVTGTLSGTNGDGALTWALSTAGAPAGFSYVANGTGLNVFQGATLVLQVTLNTATGAYTVTQVAPIQHAAGSNENNAVFTLNYTVTDIDGDVAPGTINIDVDDDSPVAANDTDSVAAGTYGPETGNVLTGAGTTSGAAGADRVGADGAAVGGAVTAVTGTAAGSIGGTTAGQYGTLTLNADGTYSYVRNAGTPGGVADTFTYTITDRDGDSTTATLTINIADAQPLTGENATVRLDDDALAGGNAGGTGDDTDAANTSGTLAASGGDGPLAWSLATTGAPAGFSYVANGTGLNVFQGTTLVMQITLNTATGAYTVTQVAPILHAEGSDENNQTFSVSFSVRDQDGDTANGTLSINVDDDTPIASDDTDAVASGTYGPVAGNVITGVGSDGNAAGADSPGADGGLHVTAVTGAAAGTIGGTTNGTYGVLTLNADGSYSYTRNAGTPGGVNDVFSYTVTDADGDTATATLTIAIADALPLTGQNAQVQLDDDAQAGGNPGGIGDGPDAVNVAGTLTGSGGDGPLTWQMTSFTSPIGFNVTLVNQGLLEIRQDSTLVMTITLDTATGAYTVTQNAPIDHSALGDENNANFSLGYRVTDQDGDIANGSLSITIDDDTPVVADDTDSLLAGATGPATGNVLTDAAPGDAGDSDTGADSLGADGGSVTRIDSVNVPANFDDTADGSGNLTVAGQYGTLTINADGSYSYTRNNGAPLNAVETFTYTVTDGDGDTAVATLTITIEDAGPITGQNATVLLDDDAQAGGNPGGTGDDVDAANLTGTLAGSGGDGALAWAMTSFTSPVGF
ncbi:VCBS domain-containing protein, partial [Novosphingobium sp.]|uniref:beta strand repeat-containing protein n=1 Tax=Novosphingobium sp. TaxID=1874826 RepID=UPI0025E7F1E4